MSTDWTRETAWASTRLPIEKASALPADAYVADDFHALELERLFGSSWVGVGFTSEVASGGNTIVRDVGGRSMLIVRDHDGVLRSFHNTCRHRGTELAADDCTLANTIRCPYHRWGYSLDGTLVATPRFADAGVEDFDKSDFGLHQARVSTFAGIVFVCLDPTAPPLDEYLGDLPDRFAGYSLEHWTTVDTATLTIESNWKLITENYQEYYHLQWVHPELAKVSRVEDHYRYQGPGMYCGQTTTPVSGDQNDEWTSLPSRPGLSATDADSGRHVAIFPNVMITVLPNHAFAFVLTPDGPHRTVERCAMLLPDATSVTSDAGPDGITSDVYAATWHFWIDLNGEDIDICERGQRGLRSGGYTPGRLSPRFEEPLHRFHNMVADKMVGVTRIPNGDASDAEDILGTGVNPLPWRPSGV